MQADIDSIILKLEEFNLKQLSLMTAVEGRDYISEKLNPESENPSSKVTKSDPNSVLKWYDKFTDRKKWSNRTIYIATQNRLIAWRTSEEKLSNVKFEDIKSMVGGI